MLLHVRPLLIVSATLLLLVACTRERPTPEPTATTAVLVNAPPTAAITAEIITDTIAPDSGSEAGIAVTNTPEALTPEAGTTPTPGTPDTFQYVVQDGDTLGSIAARFETDVEILRSLNQLDSDSLAVGQPLNVPYKEGITAEGVPTPTPGPLLYTILSGDTLNGIGARFGVDPIAILEANAANVIDPNNLVVGTTIIIPGVQTTTEEGSVTEDVETDEITEGTQVVHVVQAGEGLIQIATTYGVPVEDILAANGLTEQDILRIGQELIIPGVSARDIAVAQGNVHVVQQGESLLSIAILYNVTVEEIIEGNKLDNPDAIFVGQELVIPGQ